MLQQNINTHFNVVAANADEIFFTSETGFIQNALNQHIQNKSLATLVVIKHPEAGKKFGAIWTVKGKVVSIGKEKPSADAEPWHFIGLQIISDQIFKFLEPNKEQNIFYDILIQHLTTHDVSVYPIQADWYETGNLTDYTETKKVISEALKNPQSSQHFVFKNHMDALKKFPKSQLSDLA